MKSVNESARVFTRRGFVIAGLQGALLGVLGGRLAWLQIVHGHRYKTLSDKNRINLKIIAPSRGQIVDRFGVPLAVNNQNFRLVLIPEQVEDTRKMLSGIKQYIDLTDDEIESVVKKVGQSAKFLPVQIKENLSWEQVAKIEVNLPDLPGVSIDVGEIRNYPFAESTAHIVGYVGAVNKSEISEERVLSLPGFRIGKTGIEKRYDLAMRGKAGASEVEVNVIGREVRELNRQDSVSGERVILTIDGALQRFVQARLAQEKSASAVIMDAHTGAVYALASHPGFDPNMFTRGIPATLWEELLADPGHPLTNKAISGLYPPASTFKMITALAGLRTGKISANRTSYCPGYYEYGSDKFHCWKPGGHGTVDVVAALQKSCDVYFYELATEIGIDEIARTAREMGLGSKLDFELAEERPGLVPDKNWKIGHFGKTWQPGETIVASIGQGYLQATPLQLAVMTSRLVNGGHAVKPWVTGYVGQHRQEQKTWPRMDIDEAHMAIIKRGMDRVVNDERGTAYGSRIIEAAYAMGGKTGTAQVKRITTAQRSAGVRNEDLPWKQRHHGLFVGYAPLDNPRYACAVVVEHGVGGSASAAPVAKDIMLEVQKRDPASTDIKSDHATKTI